MLPAFSGHQKPRTRDPSAIMKSLIHSFKFALMGIRHALLVERNFRLQWLCSLLVLLLNLILPFNHEQQIFLLILIGGVLSLELMNSSIEHTCNSSGLSFNSEKKGAKDLAASSVLIFSLTALICLYFMLETHKDLFINALHDRIFAAIGLVALFFINFPACIKTLSLSLVIGIIIISLVCHLAIALYMNENASILILSIIIHGALCYTHLKRSFSLQ